MAKGQKRSSREAKKPKAAKAAIEAPSSLFQSGSAKQPPIEEPGQMSAVATTLKGISMKFRPLHDRIVVRRITAEEKSTGGIIIPDTAKEKPMEGEVIAAGPGARDEQGKVQALDVKAGDRVLFGKWSGTEVRLDGEDLLIMKESDVMGIVEGQAEQKKAA